MFLNRKKKALIHVTYDEIRLVHLILIEPVRIDDVRN